MNSIEKIVLVTILSIISGLAFAGEKTTVVLKNGSKIVGNVISQRPDIDIAIKADRATFVIEEANVVSSKQKKVKYEDLSREWKRWALEHNALQGDAYGRYLVLFDIRTKTRAHNNVAKVQRNETPMVVYVQIVPETYKVAWKEIAKIEKTVSSTNDVMGLDDDVITLDGKTYRGTIVSQIPGKKISVKTNGSTHEILAPEIIETRKIARSTAFSVNEQADYKNVLVLKDKTTKEGVIVSHHYGKKDKDKYVTLLKENGEKENVLTAKIAEYQTIYNEKKLEAYGDGKMYVNEFRIPVAKTKAEGDYTYYTDKKVFPFPEGIVITFKTKGAKLQGNWKLVVLDAIEMANGYNTQGYTSKTRVTNSIKPSTADLSEGVSNITFTYLSPGYYALVNNDSPETYIIKITE